MQTKKKSRLVFVSLLLTIATLILGTLIIKYTISKNNHSQKHGLFVFQGVTKNYASARNIYKTL